eukprot:jgi/Psemu1/297288/fgenesh1_pm.267_\
MATFAKQDSNISALGSKFDRLLKVPGQDDDNHGYFRSREKQRSAETFFVSQKRRVEEIEKELSAATVHVFPSSKESKTITELAELCRLTQDFTREKLELLKSRLEDEGYTVTAPKTARVQKDKLPPTASATHLSLDRTCNHIRTGAMSSGKIISTGESRTNGPSKDRFSWPLVTNIGGPLESVLETEYETDGLTTPGSSLPSPVWLSSGEKHDSNIFTTPSASARKQRQANQRKSSSSNGGTPPTPPTLDKLPISASTSTFLQNIGDEEENADPMSSYDRICHSQDQEKQQHLYEFRDEDDMITLDTQSTMTKSNYPYNSPVIGNTGNDKNRSEEERSHFFERMEGLLERVEETILEDSPLGRNKRNGNTSRPSDELQAASVLFNELDEEQQPTRRSSKSTVISDNKVTQSHHHTVKTFYEEEESVSTEDNSESSTNESDESTNVVATQIAEKSMSEEGLTPRESSAVQNAKRAHSHNERPTHILFESGIGSPAHTNITMDATMMNDAYEMSFMRTKERRSTDTGSVSRALDNNFEADEEIDNLSTVTPVLDRYRLDPSDDNSIGVKVVPNKRSAHRSNQKRKTTPKQGNLPTIAQLSPSLHSILQATTPQKEFLESPFNTPPISTSERHLRTMATATPRNQTRRVYRKTPFPKGKPATVKEDDKNYDSADENDHPNLSANFSVTESPEPFKSIAPSFSISVPPLRPRSFEPKHTDKSPPHSGSARNLSLPGKRNDPKNRTQTSIDGSMSFLSSGEKLSRQHLQEESNQIERIDGTDEYEVPELESPTGSNVSIPGRTNPVSKLITMAPPQKLFKDVTESEFEAAPRIVRTHVDRDQANHALDTIQKFCSDSMADIQSFEFTEKAGCNILGLSEQKSKSVLISLCHWRRLKMKKDANNGMVFVVNI